MLDLIVLGEVLSYQCDVKHEIHDDTVVLYLDDTNKTHVLIGTQIRNKFSDLTESVRVELTSGYIKKSEYFHINSKFHVEYIALKVFEHLSTIGILHNKHLKVPFTPQRIDARLSLCRGRYGDNYGRLYDLFGDRLPDLKIPYPNDVCLLFENNPSLKIYAVDIVSNITPSSHKNIQSYSYLFESKKCFFLLGHNHDVLTQKIESILKYYSREELLCNIMVMRLSLTKLQIRLDYISSKNVDVSKVPLKSLNYIDFEDRIDRLIVSMKHSNDVLAKDTFRETVGDSVSSLFGQHSTCMLSWLNDLFKKHSFLIPVANRLTHTNLGFKPECNIVQKIDDLLIYITKDDIIDLLTRKVPIKLELMYNIATRIESEQFKQILQYSSKPLKEIIKYIPKIDKMSRNLNDLMSLNNNRSQRGLDPISLKLSELCRSNPIKNILIKKRKLVDIDECDDNVSQEVIERDVKIHRKNLVGTDDTQHDPSVESDLMIENIKQQFGYNQDILINEIKKYMKNSESEVLKKKCGIFLKGMHRLRVDQFKRFKRMCFILEHNVLQGTFQVLKE